MESKRFNHQPRVLGPVSNTPELDHRVSVGMVMTRGKIGKKKKKKIAQTEVFEMELEVVP